MPLEVGRHLGPYEILSLLGSGGMGEIYRARDTRLEREVALKVLPERFLAEPASVERFVFEAKATGQLNHPNIVAVYDVDLSDPPYMVTEYLRGETLHDRLLAGPIPPRKAVALAIQVALGLDAAHQRGIIHRDLKPENVFLTEDGRVKILDFGLAKLVHSEEASMAEARVWPGLAPLDLAEEGSVIGSAGYMSPEQVRGRPADARSDVFALGAVFYEMLTQRSAFPGHSAFEWMNAILREDPPAFSERVRGVSPVLERIALRCLEKDPEDRFQSARDLAYALEAWSGAEGPQASEARSHGGATGLSRAAPLFQRLTRRRGTLFHARFAEEGRVVLHSAAWDGAPCRIFARRVDGSGAPREIAPHPGVPDDGGWADLLGVSAEGTLAVAEEPRHLGHARRSARLFRLAGDARRSVSEETEAADWSPDGLRLAVVRNAGWGSRLEFPIGTPLHESRGWISHPRFSADGELIAFLDHPDPASDQGALVITDTLGTRSPLTGLWRGIRGLAWSADGKEVLFTARGDEEGTGLHATTLSGRTRLLLRLPEEFELHDVSRKGALLISLHSRSTQVSVVPPGAAVGRDLSHLERSRLCDLSADGRFLLMACGGDPRRDLHEGVPPGAERPEADEEIWWRPTDGSRAVRVGEGIPYSLSPDGKWLLASRTDLPGRLLALPCDGGEPRLYSIGRLRAEEARWLPDGRRILLAAREGESALRLHLWDPEREALPRAIGQGGIGAGPWSISPDGRHAIGPRAAEGPGVAAFEIRSLEDGESRPLSLGEGETPIGLEAGPGAVYLFRRGMPLRIYRLDLSSGARAAMAEIAPADPAGLAGVARVCLAPSTGVAAYGSLRVLSELYLVRELE